VGDLFPHKGKDLKVKSLIPRSLLLGFSLTVPRRITVVSLDSSPARVHPDGTEALKKRRTVSGGLNTKISMMVADNRYATGFILSGREVFRCR
jgi:hypothetical protein